MQNEAAFIPFTVLESDLMRMIDTALNLAFGQAQVSVIYSTLNQYRVVMGVAEKYWQSPDALNDIYVQSPSRGQVPLSAFATN